MLTRQKRIIIIEQKKILIFKLTSHQEHVNIT